MAKKLRIATMVTGHYTTPPPKGIIYAPMDIAVEVSAGLVKRGHKVDFYGPKGTDIPGVKVIDCGLDPLIKVKGGKILDDQSVRGKERDKLFHLWDQFLIAKMFAEASKGKYDLLHIHPIDRALPLALGNPNVKVAYTMHDPVYPWKKEVFDLFSSPNQGYVSISDSQRKPAPELNYLATVYNGLKLEEFKYSEKHDDYLLFVGRIIPEKGVAEAVQAARLAGQKLLIIGPKPKNEYWDKKIKPYLGGKITHMEFVPRKQLFKYYRKAKAVLFPIQWEEPFGLIMTEAMACGTPVIATRRGSVPEVIVDGKTGFIVDTVKQMASAIKKIDSISRSDCRRHVEENFSTDKMVDGYEKAFQKFVG